MQIKSTIELGYSHIDSSMNLFLKMLLAAIPNFVMLSLTCLDTSNRRLCLVSKVRTYSLNGIYTPLLKSNGRLSVHFLVFYGILLNTSIMVKNYFHFQVFPLIGIFNLVVLLQLLLLLAPFLLILWPTDQQYHNSVSLNWYVDLRCAVLGRSPY